MSRYSYSDQPEINDGGPAFPGLNATFTGIDSDGIERYETQPSGGMTLRDYFAAKAMQARLTAFCALETHHGWTDAEIAADAYAVADAMLKAREA